MRLVPGLAGEFEELCAEYSAVDQQGRDIVTLVKMFCESHDHFEGGVQNRDYVNAWEAFLSDHKHQVTVPMVGQIIYLLVTYWANGQRLYENLPHLEKILLRDTVQEISDEINRRSAAAGESGSIQDQVDR